MNKDIGNIIVAKLSTYEAPDVIPSIGNQWTLFGENNDYFRYIKDCYKNSPTNSGIINGYVSYLFGDGLINKETGDYVDKLISRNDFRLILLDYKLYGQFAIQIIWNSNEYDRKPIKIKHIQMRKVGLEINDYGEVSGYWFCFDWNRKSQYQPQYYPKFDGIYKDSNVELLVVRRPSDDDFYSTPDYESGLVYADMERELSNHSISHIQNGFQGGTIINCNNGIPASEEIKEHYKRYILNNLTGTNNANKVIISFNDSAEQAITVDRLQVADLDAQNQSFFNNAEKMIFKAHNAPAILFSGAREGGGLGNNADELQEATKKLYRDTIFPMREVVLEGLQMVVDAMDINLTLWIKDFNSFEVEDEITQEEEITEELNIVENE